MRHDIETALSALRTCEQALEGVVPALSGGIAATVSTHLSVTRHHHQVIERAAAALESAGPKRSRLNRGEFRLLFTFDERAAETAFEGAARAAMAAGTATAEQTIYLTMRADFNDADHINLDDAAVHAALDFYVFFGLLTEERKAYVLTGYRPGDMPEPEEPEDDPEE